MTGQTFTNTACMNPTPFASEHKNRPILEDNSEVNENDCFYLTQKKCRSFLQIMIKK